MTKFQIILSIFCVILSFLPKSQSRSVWEETSLTSREKHALDKFKVLVNKTVTHDFMRKDIYLIKWLRARDLDIDDAATMLKRHLKWRQEFGIDEAVNEDWTDIEHEYPYTSDGVDYEGRPVLALSISDWDVRRAIISGKKERVVRYAFAAYEKGARRVRELQESGHNVTQFLMVANYDGFNLAQHACVQCVQLLVNFLASYESNFPGMADKIIAIKTPQTFQILLQALKTVMSPETQEAVRIWGPNPQEWQTNLLKLIPPEQLDWEFGGTRNRY